MASSTGRRGAMIWRPSAGWHGGAATTDAWFSSGTSTVGGGECRLVTSATGWFGGDDRFTVGEAALGVRLVVTGPWLSSNP
jgi:hypothetical protein